MLKEKAQQLYGRPLDQLNEAELYRAAFLLCRERLAALPANPGQRKLYYISAEFLTGKLLACNLLNLGLWAEISAELAPLHKTIADLERQEAEPSLGNGGLGRLAACYMDSVASLGLNGDGVGLYYRYGLFRQVFKDRRQEELPDRWLTPEAWARDSGRRYKVSLGGRLEVEARLWEIDVPGYQRQTRQTLKLFELSTPRPTPVTEGIRFDKSDLAHNLTEFLYPDDSDHAGRMLRIYQQYFLVSAAASLILDELKERGFTLRQLPEACCIQINDTHPSMIIPELVRRLTESGLDFATAAKLVSRTCAYTNHTILAEALEKWPLADLKEAVPQLVPVIQQLADRAAQQFPDPDTAMIDAAGQVHMARMDIHYGFSVNGVAALHTEILKKQELKAFYDIYPQKFNNKTNGISFRRWLQAANPRLADFITQKIGPAWQQDASALERLKPLAEDPNSQQEWLALKQESKIRLARELAASQGADLKPDGIYDVQIKRLHEYKRQQMNLLYIIWKYRQIKAGLLPPRPINFIFGAKAAPAYVLAKDIIHALLCMSELLKADPEVAPWLNLTFVENYNVAAAEIVIPAAEVSEQISLASKEASGTGNMKLMLNGALTLGTLDGANVEIADLVGGDNIYIFGQDADTVMALYKSKSYDPVKLAKDPEIKALLKFLIGPQMLALGDKAALERLYQDLTHKDWFMTLLDLKDYIKVKEQVFADYENRSGWAQMALLNIASAGYFTADRSVAEYNRDIWKLN
ncbi:MAG: glycogen/starch/alpha-glucan phosphorylase [Oscillospiraceae bacterium]|nr:glycogen/starch/alpha-glucan phosphorylase [Oscillospiraceae bacterium]MDD4369217.1 glycogen/starch/alpha-glucan phosphorylase [Oscillospiraceae bacterium]